MATVSDAVGSVAVTGGSGDAGSVGSTSVSLPRLAFRSHARPRIIPSTAIGGKPGSSPRGPNRRPRVGFASVTPEDEERQRASHLAERSAAGSRAAIDWLAREQAPDGTFGVDGDAWLYAGHKAPAAFAAGGHALEAGRAATWLVANRLRPDGDIGDASNRSGPARA